MMYAMVLDIMKRADEASLPPRRPSPGRTMLGASHIMAAGDSNLTANDVNPVFSPSVLARFWSKVDKGDGVGCWLWTASLNNGGYGQLSLCRRPCPAHRISYMIANGPIPDGLFVCHRCDVRRCVNPSHLFLGTAQDNIRDMVEKGRNHVIPALVGDHSPNSKLKSSDVIAIRRDHAAGASLPELGRRYGVTAQAIWRVVHKINWRHI